MSDCGCRHHHHIRPAPPREEESSLGPAFWLGVVAGALVYFWFIRREEARPRTIN
jgi:hypothetical protein